MRAWIAYTVLVSAFFMYDQAWADKFNSRLLTEIINSDRIRVPTEGEVDGRPVTVLVPYRDKIFDGYLPVGTKLSLVPSRTLFGALHGVHYLDDKGEIKPVYSKYYGSLIIHRVPPGSGISEETIARLNRMEIYIHYRNTDNPRVIRSLYTEGLPKGAEAPYSDLGWEEMNPQGTWGYYLWRAIMANREELMQGELSDIAEFCPNYHNLNLESRAEFWARLASNLSRRESLWDPFSATDEDIFSEVKKGVVSSGLLQMSLRSVQNSAYRQRGCEVRNQMDLFDPEQNIKCAVAIFATQVGRASCLSCRIKNQWQGLAAYWSPMRARKEVPCKVCPGGKVVVGAREEIAADLSALPICRRSLNQ